MPDMQSVATAKPNVTDEPELSAQEAMDVLDEFGITEQDFQLVKEALDVVMGNDDEAAEGHAPAPMPGDTQMMADQVFNRKAGGAY